MQPDLRMAPMSNPRQGRIQLAVREHRTRQVHADDVQREALAAVERRRVRRRERELPSHKGVPRLERRRERDARD